MRASRAAAIVHARRCVMRVRDVMTTEVVTVRPDLSVKDAAEMLARCSISGVPVVDDSGEVVGVFSEADILVRETGARGRSGILGWFLEPDFELEAKIRAENVGGAMTTPALTISSSRPVHEAAARMVEDSVNRLPVVDDGKLVGIVSRADLVRAFTRTDEEIGDEIRNEILTRSLWLDPSAVSVTVKDGAVRLAGEVETDADAELLPVLVGRLPGVVSVEAELHSRERLMIR
jgi:CBS domain-containing protein